MRAITFAVMLAFAVLARADELTDTLRKENTELKAENARLQRELKARQELADASAEQHREERRILAKRAEDAGRLEAHAQRQIGRLGESNVMLMKEIKQLKEKGTK